MLLDLKKNSQTLFPNLVPYFSDFCPYTNVPISGTFSVFTEKTFPQFLLVLAHAMYGQM